MHCGCGSRFNCLGIGDWNDSTIDAPPGRQNYCAIQPPSITTSVPVMKPASSEQR